MADPYLVELVRKAIEEQRKILPKERFAAMVRRGAIDETGKILLRMPEPPGGWPEEEDTNGESAPILNPPAL